jgi:hypothetical protein
LQLRQKISEGEAAVDDEMIHLVKQLAVEAVLGYVMNMFRINFGLIPLLIADDKDEAKERIVFDSETDSTIESVIFPHSALLRLLTTFFVVDTKSYSLEKTPSAIWVRPKVVNGFRNYG